MGSTEDALMIFTGLFIIGAIGGVIYALVDSNNRGQKIGDKMNPIPSVYRLAKWWKYQLHL